jgi:hypothetical protein
MKEQLTRKSEELIKTIQQQNEYKNKLIGELRQVETNLVYLQGKYEQLVELIKEENKEESTNDVE